MIEHIDTSLIDWSRAQFALTAIYHWLFVPLTLGLGICQAIMETIYYRTGNVFWKNTARFWMKLFGINFAIGVATGLILEFQFGTNWSNYSWFVGDIFGAPLAIEGIIAFFMEATFIAVMYFGWDKVSRGFHLTSTWLTVGGATISAWWILVANSWMQYPVGMEFNPDTVRSEMVSFSAVALSPVAVNKFFHTVLSSWVVGGAFVVGVSCWYLLKKRHVEMASRSLKLGALFGLVAILLTIYTGDGSGYQVAQKQPMKLAAMEAHYNGCCNAGLVAVGLLNTKDGKCDCQQPFLFDIKLPSMLSLLAQRNVDGFVPGINDLLKGGYKMNDGTTALSAAEKIARGKTAIAALAKYKQASANHDAAQMAASKATLQKNFPYFGYGYVKSPDNLVPNVPIVFYAFRVMVMLGGFLLLYFIVVWYLQHKQKLANMRWMLLVGILTIPLAYITSQSGWIVAELGRQPWAIQDLLPVGASVSSLQTSSVQTTFFLFLVLFTVLLIADVGILLWAIRKGPETESVPTPAAANDAATPETTNN
jgi:cytochrome d ubiquinol oxidase subunit I